jgi:photosystem II stability/assembly factor-like uncharacterized protein
VRRSEGATCRRVGGIFKSTDGGASWQAANARPSIIETTALAADPVNPDSVYAAAGYDGIFKTVDHGANWKGLAALRISTESPTGISVSVDAAPAAPLSLAIDFLHPAVLYTWTYSGTFLPIRGQSAVPEYRRRC